MTYLTLVRHATTEWMEQNRLHGILDSPLSSQGVREAQSAARRLAGRKFDSFYCSPLGRARQTAEIIAQVVSLEPQVLEGLRELNFGWLEGGGNFNFQADPPLRRALRRRWMGVVMFLSGETRRDFARRVIGAYHYILDKNPDQRVLVVTHTAVLSNLMAYILDGTPARWPRYYTWAPTGITEIEVASQGTVKLVAMDQHEHLSELRSVL